MCVSTGKVGYPKAWLMTTEAVLCPTPGSASSSGKVEGTCPPCRSSNRRESSASDRLFPGASPHCRISSRMALSPSAAIFAGSGATRKSAGVTSLTFLSVHCALSTTATSRVKASEWFRGIGGSG